MFCDDAVLECDTRRSTEALHFAPADAFILVLLDTIQISCDDLKLQAGASGIEYKDVHARFSLLGKYRTSKSPGLRFFRLSGDRHELFGEFVGVHGVLVRLLTQLVSGQMISFAMGGGSGGMGVSCQVVKLCGSIVRALWHEILLLS